jgi:predicted O-methyltransferase YrrM
MLEIVREGSDARSVPRPGASDRAIASAAEVASSLAGDPSLGELAYGCVRAIRPAFVVETGVATGVTTAYTLAGLADNDHGHLHSIDLPPTNLYLAGQVARVVPDALRSRWTYHWGHAKRLLPRVFGCVEVAPQLFIHDSDHSYDHMRWELEQAWDALGTPGVLLADDADVHTAVGDVAAAKGAECRFVVQEDKPGATGIIMR